MVTQSICWTIDCIFTLAGGPINNSNLIAFLLLLALASPSVTFGDEAEPHCDLSTLRQWVSDLYVSSPDFELWDSVEAYKAKWKQAYQDKLGELNTDPKTGQWSPTLEEVFLAEKKLHNPQIRIFEKVGFAFGKKVHVPDFDVMGRLHDELMAEHVKLGTPRNDVIRPGIPIVGPGGQLDFIGYDGVLPPNWKVLDPSRLESKWIGKMIRAGFFPLSNGDRVHHDFSHLTGFGQHPDYMSAMRWLDRQYASGSHRPDAKDMSARFYYFLEGLSLAKKEKRAEILELLPQPFKSAGEKTVTVDKVFRFHKKQKLHDRLMSSEKLLMHGPDLIKEYGGAAREIGTVYTDSDLKHSLSNLLHRVEELTDEIHDFRELGRATPPRLQDRHARALARLEVGMWETSRMTPHEFAEQLVPPQAARDSLIYRAMIGSGLAPKDPFSQSLVLESPRLIRWLGPRVGDLLSRLLWD